MRIRSAVAALAVVVVSGLAAAACGGAETPPPAAPPPPSAEPAASTAPAESAAPAASAAPAESAAPAASAAPGGPPKAGEWDTWSHEQKLEYMKTAVMPKLGDLFHTFDPKRYAEPKCSLCHGSGAKDGSFKMPNPELPKLPGTPEGFAALKAKHPKVVDFMIKDVEATTADLIGETPFDPKTKQGFGCMNCHTKK